MSLYEVSDVRPGESFLARDLVRGGDPIRVTERTATKTLVAWDVIACPHRHGAGRGADDGAVLSIDRGLAEDMLALLRRTQSRAPNDGRPDLRGGRPRLAGAAGGRTRYRGCGPACRRGHDHHPLAEPRDPPRSRPAPQLANTDGEPLEFVTLHYRLAPAASAEGIAASSRPGPRPPRRRRRSALDLVRAGKPSPKRRRRKGNDDPDTGRTIHGNLTLTAKTLEARVNSEARCARLRSLLTPDLAGLVREPLIERMTVGAGHGGSPRRHVICRSGSPRVSTRRICAAIHEVMDRHIERPSMNRCRCWAGKARARRCAAPKGGLPSPTGSRASSSTMRAARRMTRCGTTISAGCGSNSGSPTFVPDRRKAGGGPAVLTALRSIRSGHDRLAPPRCAAGTRISVAMASARFPDTGSSSTCLVRNHSTRRSFFSCRSSDIPKCAIASCMSAR